MTSVIKVSASSLVLGKSQDNALALALALDSISVPSTEIQLSNNALIQSAFMNSLNAGQSLAERQYALLSKAFDKLDTVPENESIFLLLPWFDQQNEHELEIWLRNLAKSQPHLLNGHQTKIFPYGRAAILMAMTQAEQTLSKNPNQKIWLMAVDSFANDQLLKTLNENGHILGEEGNGFIPSEGAVVLCLEASDAEGLIVQFSQSDASLSLSTASQYQDDPALGTLFALAAEQIATPLQHLYLPDNGDEKLTACWLGQYEHLSKILAEDVEMHLTGHFTGELGAAGGLYRFLHMYEALRTKRIEGTVMQCEISDRLYRSVAVFDWNEVI